MDSEAYKKKYYELSVVTRDLLLESGFVECGRLQHWTDYLQKGPTDVLNPVLLVKPCSVENDFVRFEFQDVIDGPTVGKRDVFYQCRDCLRLDFIDKRICFTDENKYWEEIQLVIKYGSRHEGRLCPQRGWISSKPWLKGLL